MDQRLTLNRARKSGKLKEFIEQEESRGVVGDADALDGALQAALKPPKAKHRTSRSQGRGSSGGSQTR
jgi:hypothetical protein